MADDESVDSGDSLFDLNKAIQPEKLADMQIMMTPVSALVLQMMNQWGYSEINRGFFSERNQDFPILDGKISVLRGDVGPEEFLAGLERSYNLLTWGFLKSGDDSPIKEVYPVLWDRMLREKSEARDKIFLLGQLGSIASTTKKFDFVLPLNYYGGEYDIPRIPHYTFRYQDRPDKITGDMIVQCTGRVYPAPYSYRDEPQPSQLCRVISMSARRKFGRNTLSFKTIEADHPDLLLPKPTVLDRQVDLLKQDDPFCLKGDLPDIRLPLNGLYILRTPRPQGSDDLLGGIAVQFVEKGVYRIQYYDLLIGEHFRSLKPLNPVFVVGEDEARQLLNAKLQSLIE